MSPQHEPADIDSAKRVGRELALSLVAGTAGIAATAGAGGHPLAGVAANAATRTALVTLVERWSARGRARAEGVLELASRESGLDAAHLIETLEVSASGEELLVRTLRLAHDAGVAEKLLVAARALASGALATDDAGVDIEVLMVRALQDLDMVHLRLLEKFTMTGAELDIGSGPEHDVPPDALDSEQLKMVAPELADVMPALTGALQSHGLIEMRTPGASWADPPIKVEVWRITDQGRVLVDRLLALGDAAGNGKPNATRSTAQATDPD